MPAATDAQALLREQPALRALLDRGWLLAPPESGPNLQDTPRELLWRQRLIAQLQLRRFDYRGRSHPLSPGAIDQVLRELAAPPLADGLLAANERLYQQLVHGVTVTEFMADGRRHRVTVEIVDWRNPLSNDFVLVAHAPEPALQGRHPRLPGVVGFVNGVPLLVLEIDSAPHGAAGGDAMAEAIRRHLRHQRDDEIARLFAYAQLLVAVAGGEARYGTTRTPANRWSRVPRADAGPAGAAASQALADWLAPVRLLEMLHDFIVFDRRHGKMVARPHQVAGVQAVVERLQCRQPDGARPGGVVWHSAGSGKSLSMLFLAKALLRHPMFTACRLLVVTDRIDLEQQLARAFASGSAQPGSGLAAHELERSRAATGRELAQRIGHGAERITFALVQKFNTAARLPECRNASPDLVVLVDEAHRSHGGLSHQRLRRALPQAACVAFTGTPLLRQQKTTARFGPIIHAYTLRQAVEDGAVLPLLYEERMPPGPFDAADPRAAAEARMAWLAADISAHFRHTLGAAPVRLKAQVAVCSRRDAVRCKQALDAIGQVSSAIVMSPPEGLDTAPPAEGPADEAARELHRWWRQHMPARAADLHDRDRALLAAFGSDAGPDLLIVVDRLLTGFDEARNAVLYLDKPLEGHALIQAVCRVNRLHEARTHGLIVDYRGVLRALDTAMRDYQDLAHRSQGGFDLQDLQGLYRRVPPVQLAAPRAVPSGQRGRAGERSRGWRLQAAPAGVHEPPAQYLVHRLGGTGPGTATAPGSPPQAQAPSASEAGLRRESAVGAARISVPTLPPPLAAEHLSAARLSAAEQRALGTSPASHPMPDDSAAPSTAPSCEALCHESLREALGAQAAARDRQAPPDMAALPALDSAELQRLAVAMAERVEAARAEHSLHPENIEAALRQALLRLLHGPLGLQATRRAIDALLRRGVLSGAGRAIRS